MIQVTNLNKSFGKTKALNGVSFSLIQGVVGLLGPNGSGKTTLLRHLTAIYPDTTDAILYRNGPIRTNKNYQRQFGYLPQHFGLFPYLTVFEGLQLLADAKEMSKAKQKEAIAACLEEVALTSKTNEKIKKLSGGMLRRVGIAQTILGNPSMRFFDEPTAGLDPEERLRFKNLMVRSPRETLTIISTHIVEDVEAVCDTILVMNAGRIVFQGTQQELAAQADGLVHEWTANEAAKLENIRVLRHTMKDDVDMVRFLSAVPIPEAQVPPTIEDGYLSLCHDEIR